MERIEVLPHDLIKITVVDFFSEQVIPDWVVESLNKTPLVIVRRGHAGDGKIPVGVRGVKREQRFAGYVLSAKLHSEDIITPHSLIQNSWDKLPEVRRMLPAIAAFPKIAPLLNNYHWGISGSVGFELASGASTAKSSSDLDLIWYESQKLSREESVELLNKLNQFGVHADFQVVHGQKGFSLEEFAKSTSDTILIKTADGPKLSNDPWAEIEKD